MPAAVETVRAFRRLRALVIGDAMLDSYLEGTAARLCTEGPVAVVRKTTEQRVPGGAANAAANLRALGADVLFAGVVGRDVAAGLLRTALAERGVDTKRLMVSGLGGEDPFVDNRSAAGRAKNNRVEIVFLYH